MSSVLRKYSSTASLAVAWREYFYIYIVVMFCKMKYDTTFTFIIKAAFPYFNTAACFNTWRLYSFGLSHIHGKFLMSWSVKKYSRLASSALHSFMVTLLQCSIITSKTIDKYDLENSTCKQIDWMERITTIKQALEEECIRWMYWCNQHVKAN